MSRISNLAPESDQIVKMRRKLEIILRESERAITPQALQKKVSEIYRWIGLHASARVVLGKKEISLFDANRNPAAASQLIVKMEEQFRQSMNISSTGVASRNYEKQGA